MVHFAHICAYGVETVKVMSIHKSNFFGMAKLTLVDGMNDFELSSCVSGMTGYGAQCVCVCVWGGGREGGEER